MNIITKPCASINYEFGRRGYKIKAIVVHIAEGTLAGTDEWFNTPRPEKPSSAHYIVAKSGEIHRYVSDENTAYHAGEVINPTCAEWITAQNPNYITIGIENEGYSGQQWTLTQMIALRALVKELCLKYNIPQDREHIVSHHAIKSYKENMDSWIIELLRVPTSTSLKLQLIGLLQQYLAWLQKEKYA